MATEKRLIDATPIIDNARNVPLACSGFSPSDLDKDVFHYCKDGRAEEIPDIEQRCDAFKDRNKWKEVVCGRWIPVPSSDMMTGKAYKCSECGKMRYGSYSPNFCQCCGADMRERKDND